LECVYRLTTVNTVYRIDGMDNHPNHGTNTTVCIAHHPNSIKLTL
jgi:hypothetical protein